MTVEDYCQMAVEVWKPVVGFEKSYEISNQGRLKSKKRRYVLFDKILPGRKDKDGYHVYQLAVGDGTFKDLKAHRLVAIAFIPNPNNFPQVNHKDGDKSNNNDWNLEWCTDEYNHAHAKKLGLHKATSSSFKKGDNQKINNEDRVEIRRLRRLDPKKYKSVFFQRKFKVSKSAIYSIVYGET